MCSVANVELSRTDSQVSAADHRPCNRFGRPDEPASGFPRNQTGSRVSHAGPITHRRDRPPHGGLALPPSCRFTPAARCGSFCRRTTSRSTPTRSSCCSIPTAATRTQRPGLAPLLSRRNYIAACPRGPVALGPGPTGRPRFGWDEADPLAEAYLQAVVAHAHSEYHVHSERVYLFGVGEGATVAYRLGLTMADSVAGVVALNGRFPAPRRRPLAIRGLRVFIGHGVSNPVVPVAAARKDSACCTRPGRTCGSRLTRPRTGSTRTCCAT